MMNKGIAILITVFLSAGAVVALLTVAETARPPGTWIKYIGNPVVTKGPDFGDASSVGFPTVLLDNMLYKMWYTGRDGGIGDFAIGYATSTDGITWTKYAGNPVITGSAGQWDANVLTGDVVFDGSKYRIWYWGFGELAGGVYSIGYATSTNGITWTKYVGNPIITPPVSEFDSRFILCPTVISNNGHFKMWLPWMDDSGTWSIVNITSTDGISWSNQSNPVLQNGPLGSWDGSSVVCPDVVIDNGTYRMWYSGEDAFRTEGIGQASSPDGISWTKSSNNPVLGGGVPGSWDWDVRHSSVILEDKAYKMWYEGSQFPWNSLIGYARTVGFPPVNLDIAGPDSGLIDTTYHFTATTAPISATIPLTYVWQATGQTPVTHTVGLTDTAGYNWGVSGAKHITVTVRNDFGAITKTHSITLSSYLYLPAILKP